MSEWLAGQLRSASLWTVLKLASVIFVICMYVLFIVVVILEIVAAYS